MRLQGVWLGEGWHGTPAAFGSLLATQEVGRLVSLKKYQY